MCKKNSFRINYEINYRYGIQNVIKYVINDNLYKMGEALSNLSCKGAEVYGVKNKISLVQVIDLSDLKCENEENNIAKPQNSV